MRAAIQDLRRQRDDFHELRCAQFTNHRAKNARADRLALLVDQHGGVAVEPDGAAIGAAHGECRTHDHRLVDVALLDLAAGNRFLHGHNDHVADRSEFPLGTAQHFNALHPLGAGIIGDIQVGLGMDHFSAPFPYA